MITEVFSTEDLSQEDPNFMYEMFSSIDDFVSLPEGGTPWKVFADTGICLLYTSDAADDP